MSTSQISKECHPVVSVVSATIGSVILSMLVPWANVFSDTIPIGGDNPAHPVLAASLREALFHHGQIIHYSFSFWAGFELFQFYFPFPYILIALLSFFVGMNIAFKLITLLPILLLPAAFWGSARLLGLTRLSCLLSGMLGVCFLFTDAHRIWGGNIFSALSGMIGNAWSFVFLSLALAVVLRSREQEKFSIMLAPLILLTALSHFYGLLLLLLAYLVFVIEDVILIVKRKKSWRQLIRIYLAPLLAGGLLAWWIIPLLIFRQYSSDYGINWDISLSTTFTIMEQVLFGVSSGFFLIVILTRRNEITSRSPIYLLSISAIVLALFYSNYFINSQAFINVRLWPLLYFCCFLIYLLFIDEVVKRGALLSRVLVTLSLLALLPSSTATTEAEGWMMWNYRGLQATLGWNDFNKIISALQQEAPSRVAFESAPRSNSIIGSIRAFELIPFLTKHEIIEGGIVNSATYPGIAYMLQCMSSNSCAGWPPGSIMPSKDIPRAIDYLSALGVGYYITGSEDTELLFKSSAKVTQLVQGEYLSLFKVNEKVDTVEVYRGAVPLLRMKRPGVLILNLPRWDILRHQAVAFTDVVSESTLAGFRSTGVNDFFNFLVEEWHLGARASDSGGGERRYSSRDYFNGYLFLRNARFNKDAQGRGDGSGGDNEVSSSSFEPVIADIAFNPSFISNEKDIPRSDVVLPLLRVEPGRGTIQLSFAGYQAQVDGVEVHANQNTTIEFRPVNIGAKQFNEALIVFRPIPDVEFRYIDAVRVDKDITVGLAAVAKFSRAALPEVVSEECRATVSKSFERLVLRTRCPGKPHLIKYSYYPSWKSSSPIYLATNGFMITIPQAEETEIVHRRPFLQNVAVAISICSLIVLLVLVVRPLKPS